MEIDIRIKIGEGRRKASMVIRREGLEPIAFNLRDLAGAVRRSGDAVPPQLAALETALRDFVRAGGA